MKTTLCLETSTKVCSASLFIRNQLVDWKEEDGSYSHAEKLALFIEEILHNQQIQIKDLKTIAVSKGPGSYTGLRIGVSLAKGLAYGLNIPLISIDSLKSMAWAAKQQVTDPKALFCPMIDARRMEVYTALYTSELKLKKEISAEIIDEKSFNSILDENNIYFFGDGAEKCKSVLTHSNANFLPIKSSAKYMGELAEKSFLNSDFEDSAYFEPYYLKEFVALKSKKLI